MKPGTILVKELNTYIRAFKKSARGLRDQCTVRDVHDSRVMLRRIKNMLTVLAPGFKKKERHEWLREVWGNPQWLDDLLAIQLRTPRLHTT